MEGGRVSGSEMKVEDPKPKRSRTTAMHEAQDTLATVWSVVGSFLDPLDLARCAKTCRQVRTAAVDEASGKIIASHVKLGISNCHQHRAQVLLSVCVEKIQELSFDATEETADPNAFATIIAILRDCPKLEKLRIDITFLFRFGSAELDPSAGATLLVIMENIFLGLRSLDYLEITSNNDDFSEGSLPELFLRAVTRYIAENRLRNLTLWFNTVDLERDTCSILPDLACAIVRATNLSELNLMDFGQYFFTVLANQIRERSSEDNSCAAPPGLRNLCLHERPPFSDEELQHENHLAVILDFYSSCDNLETVFLRFPPEKWESPDCGSECLRRFLSGKNGLRTICLLFHCLQDPNAGATDLKIGDFIADLATTKEWESFNVEELRFTKVTRDKIRLYLEEAGVEYKFVESKSDVDWVDCSWLEFPCRAS